MKVKLASVKKALVAVAGVFAVLGTVLADGSVDGSEALSVVAAVSVAIGVYKATNVPVK